MKMTPHSVRALAQLGVGTKPSALHLLASKPVKRAPSPRELTLLAALRSVLDLVDRRAYLTAEQQLKLWQAMEVVRQ